jgi:cell wall-associated NlpC family hydrolase
MSAAAKVTSVRAEPREDAEQVTQLLPGEPVEVLSEANGWSEIRTAYGYPGWARSDALGAARDPGWLASTARDPLEAARRYLGAPYRWGGMTEAGIDCSGLVHMAYRAVGRLVGRDADQQALAGTRLGEPEASGDLVVYGDPVDHVAFWLGEGRILHATGREGVRAVVEEEEPAELRARRSAVVRL